MRGVSILAMAIALGAVSAASAQEGSGTLQGQMYRSQEQTGMHREWPADNGDNGNMVAPGSMIGSEGSGAIPALPPLVQQEGNVTFINGGISDEDVAELKAHAKEYNLHLLISAANGEYVSNIRLDILDAKGNPVLTLSDAGPYVYARLAPGTYQLEASSPEGGLQKRRIKISAKGTVKEHFAFKE